MKNAAEFREDLLLFRRELNRYYAQHWESEELFPDAIDAIVARRDEKPVEPPVPLLIDGGHPLDTAARNLADRYYGGVLPSDPHQVEKHFRTIVQASRKKLPESDSALRGLLKTGRVVLEGKKDLQLLQSEMSAVEAAVSSIVFFIDATIQRLDSELSAQTPSRKSPAGPAPSPDTDQGNNPKKTKRSTERDEAQPKLIGALTAHHTYRNDQRPFNQDPISNNELARIAGVSGSTASAFFKKNFGGHGKYKIACRDAKLIEATLKFLNGEYSPRLLLETMPSAATEHNDTDKIED